MKLHRLLPLLVACACSKSSPPSTSESPKPVESTAKVAPAPAPAARPAPTAQPAPAAELEEKETTADAFNKTADAKAAKTLWAESGGVYTAPDGTSHSLVITEKLGTADENSVQLDDKTQGLLVRDELGGNASEVSGRVAVLPNGHVLFDASYLSGPRSISHVYTLAWDASAAKLVPTSRVRYFEEM